MPGPLVDVRAPIRSTASSVTAWMLAARSMCRCSQRRLGRSRRAAEEPWNRPLVIVSPWQ